MKRIIVYPLLIIATIFLTLCIHIGLVIYFTPPEYTPLSTFSSEKVLGYIQNYRKENNLSELKESKALCKVAGERVLDIRETFSHDLFYEKFNSYPTVMIENIIRGYPDEFATFNRWITSPSHNEAILSDSQYTCMRCITIGHYCVQIFSKSNPD